MVSRMSKILGKNTFISFAMVSAILVGCAGTEPFGSYREVYYNGENGERQSFRQPTQTQQSIVTPVGSNTPLQTPSLSTQPETLLSDKENSKNDLGSVDEYVSKPIINEPVQVVDLAKQNVTENIKENLPKVTPTIIQAPTNEEEQILSEKIEEGIPNFEEIKKEFIEYRKQALQTQRVFIQQVQSKWGKSFTPTVTPSIYTKYTDSYLSEAKVDFQKGVIEVGTIDTKNPKEALKQAIVTTLLTPDDPREVNLDSSEDVQFTSKPYLANLVRDHDGEVVLYEWRANRYADYLINNKLQTKEIVTSNNTKQTMYYVTFPMSSDREAQSELKYSDSVSQLATLYKIEPELIWAIIKTESSFNPYAVSRIPAYGLMQVVPITAGRDAHEVIHNRKGTPTKEMLFNPNTNIQYGTTYLNILATRYLKGIKNPQSMEYCMIAAYNTGSGNVLRVFHSDRKKAVDVINNLTASEVYRKLRTSLRYEEARNYIYKVTEAKKEFKKTKQIALALM